MRGLIVDLSFPVVIVVLIVVGIIHPSSAVAGVSITAAGCVAVAQGIYAIAASKRRGEHDRRGDDRFHRRGSA
jgi:ABC-type dipeptide/oligopeptide/nickel transport system permease subunit